MKKNIFFAALLAFGMVALGSCSKTEGENAANAESVEGATDGVEVIQESAEEFESVDSVAVPTEEMQDAVATEAEGQNLIEKGKEAVEKGKEVVEKGKEVYEDGKNKVTDLVQKGKDAVEKGKDAVENLKK